MSRRGYANLAENMIIKNVILDCNCVIVDDIVEKNEINVWFTYYPFFVV